MCALGPAVRSLPWAAVGWWSSWGRLSITGLRLQYYPLVDSAGMQSISRRSLAVRLDRVDLGSDGRVVASGLHGLEAARRAAGRRNTNSIDPATVEQMDQVLAATAQPPVDPSLPPTPLPPKPRTTTPQPLASMPQTPVPATAASSSLGRWSWDGYSRLTGPGTLHFGCPSVG